MQKESEIRGLKTSWLEENPSGEEVIFFLHGFPDTARAWQELIQNLSTEFHCIAPFVRGLQESPLGEKKERLSLDAQTLDFFEIIKKAQAEKKTVHIVCHDLGAVPAWRLAALLGEKLGSLTVINGLSLKQFIRRMKSDRKQLKKSWYIYLFQIPGLAETIIKKSPGFIFKKAGELGGRDPQSFENDALNGFRLYRQYFKETPEELKTKIKIKKPVLSLNSLKDAFLVPTNKDELERDAEKFEIRILKGKHWIHHEQPQEIADLIRDHIRKSHV